MTLTSPAPLAEPHELVEFDSGVSELDGWLRRRARANQAGGASHTFVVCDGNHVVAYYALASGVVRTPEALGRFKRNMPDPIPVAVLGWLAIDRTYQGLGIGRALVRDAGLRLINAAEILGIRGALVPAISDDARDFYEAVGFLPSPSGPMMLMIGLNDLSNALSA